MSQRVLTPLLKQYGIQRAYVNAAGEEVTAEFEPTLAVLHALGADTDGDIKRAVARAQAESAARVLEPVIVAWDGRLRHVRVGDTVSDFHYDIILESGEVLSGQGSRNRFGRAGINVTLPLGYHELRVNDQSALIIAAPRRCHTSQAERGWGLFAPLYSLRTDDKEIGDFADAERMMRWTRELGGDVFAMLPISATFLREPFDPSPYSPASRLYWNELYLSEAPHAHALALAHANTQFIDYRTTADAKRQTLEPQANAFFAANEHRGKAFAEFLKLYPDAEAYARFRAEREREDSAHYHLYAQFLCHTQLTHLAETSAATGVQLYLDMPLGVHGDGYDVARYPELFVTGASAGAPPDPFFSKGQNWGFPPMNPVAMRNSGYEYWRRVLQTQLRYAGVLRLDHVMSLHRLYFVPSGHEATQGVYVTYNAEEFYAVLTLESARHEAVIVGEDLGTVPDEVREAMDQHGVHRMYVVQFEANEDSEKPLPEVPAQSVASLNTHDMPPLRAYWESADAELRRELGLLDDEGVKHARAARERTTRGLARLFGASGAMDTQRARTELLRWLARSPANLVLVNLEDLWLEREPQNVPGTSHERPNWRRRLKYTIAELQENGSVRGLLKMIDTERHAG